MKNIAIPIRRNKNKTVIIYVDNYGSKDIFEYLNGPKIRRIEFYEILEIIFEGLSNPEKYQKIKISKKHLNYYGIIISQPWNKACILCKESRIEKKKHIVLLKIFKGPLSKNQELIKDYIETKGEHNHDLK